MAEYNRDALVKSGDVGAMFQAFADRLPDVGGSGEFCAGIDESADRFLFVQPKEGGWDLGMNKKLEESNSAGMPEMIDKPTQKFASMHDLSLQSGLSSTKKEEFEDYLTTALMKANDNSAMLNGMPIYLIENDMMAWSQNNKIALESLPCIAVVGSKRGWWTYVYKFTCSSVDPDGEYVITGGDDALLDPIKKSVVNDTSFKIQSCPTPIELQPVSEYLAPYLEPTLLDAVLTTDAIKRGQATEPGEVYDKDGRLFANAASVSADDLIGNQEFIDQLVQIMGDRLVVENLVNNQEFIDSIVNKLGDKIDLSTLVNDEAFINSVIQKFMQSQEFMDSLTELMGDKIDVSTLVSNQTFIDNVSNALSADQTFIDTIVAKVAEAVKVSRVDGIAESERFLKVSEPDDNLAMKVSTVTEMTREVVTPVEYGIPLERKDLSSITTSLGLMSNDYANISNYLGFTSGRWINLKSNKPPIVAGLYNDYSGTVNDAVLVSYETTSATTGNKTLYLLRGYVTQGPVKLSQGASIKSLTVQGTSGYRMIAMYELNVEPVVNEVVQQDALLTTDNIERQDPGDLRVYTDDQGKLRVSEAAVGESVEKVVSESAGSLIASFSFESENPFQTGQEIVETGGWHSLLFPEPFDSVPYVSCTMEGRQVDIANVTETGFLYKVYEYSVMYSTYTSDSQIFLQGGIELKKRFSPEYRTTGNIVCYVWEEASQRYVKKSINLISGGSLYQIGTYSTTSSNVVTNRNLFLKDGSEEKYNTKVQTTSGYALALTPDDVAKNYAYSNPMSWLAVAIDKEI